MNSTAQAQQFGQLRARIEATFSEPVVIVVTSAARGDGKTATAFGLAESLASAEHRVLFVDANVEAPTLARIHRLRGSEGYFDTSSVGRYASKVAGQRFSGISFADERAEFGLSMDKIKASVADMRAHFEYIIVDTTQLLHSDLALLFATIADGTLLTVRLGRLPLAADGETMKALTRVGANMLGVLTVTQAMIKDFAGARQDIIQTVRIPARHVTTRHTLAPPEPAREVVESRSNVIS